MKRFGLGITLLVVLLVLSLGVWWGMEQLHRPLTRELALAAALSLEGNGEAARETALQARGSWQKYWHFMASFADHTPMEQIDDLFHALVAYDPESEDFTACCLQLAQRTAAMAHAQGLSWWDLL